jgi:hypothetical protein
MEFLRAAPGDTRNYSMIGAVGAGDLTGSRIPR